MKFDYFTASDDDILAEAARRSTSAPAVATKPKKKRGPAKPRAMNMTETRYALMLEAERHNGSVWHFEYEALTLKLANGVRYTPDFLVWALPATGVAEVQLHEVKGAYIRDDARIKLAVAAKQFPMFRFVRAQWDKGAWTITDMSAAALASPATPPESEPTGEDRT